MPPELPMEATFSEHESNLVEDAPEIPLDSATSIPPDSSEDSDEIASMSSSSDNMESSKQSLLFSILLSIIQFSTVCFLFVMCRF